MRSARLSCCCLLTKAGTEPADQVAMTAGGLTGLRKALARGSGVSPVPSGLDGISREAHQGTDGVASDRPQIATERRGIPFLQILMEFGFDKLHRSALVALESIGNIRLTHEDLFLGAGT